MTDSTSASKSGARTAVADRPPTILDLPIGLSATGMRREFDSLGDVEVPANRY